MVTLDEVIEIHACDPRTLDPKALRKYGELCTQKEAQEKMKQEHKNTKVIEDVKEILMQVAPDVNVDETTPIID